MPDSALPTSALYQTILSQPAVIQSVLDSQADLAADAATIVAAATRVFLVGTGTSSHAAVVGEHLLRSVGVDAYGLTNFDFVTYPRPFRPGDALIAISHRGSKSYGQQAIARATMAGVPVIGITGQESPMVGPTVVLATAPSERSATHTASYTANLAALAQISVLVGERTGVDVAELRSAVGELPEALSALLAKEHLVREVATALAARQRLVLAGAGPNAVTAREGALKVKESSFITAEGFELETILHGGLQAVNAGDVAVVIAARGPALLRSGDLVRAFGLIGAHLMLVVDERAANTIQRPESSAVPFTVISHFAVPESLSPILAVVPLQLLSAFTADALGTNADSFRADDPVYKKVNQSYTL